MKTRKDGSKETDTKTLFKSESAAATVIAAVLLLSIIFTIFAVVRIAYVPEWKNDAEQSHMSEVQRDMKELKSTADMITLLQSSNSNSSPIDFSVTVPISMGGGEIPILEPSKSSGTLSVNTEPCNIIIKGTPINGTLQTRDQKCGGITYYSNNRQYADQVFRYENGALILKQGNRSLMRQSPSFRIERNPTNRSNYTVLIQEINISGNPDTISSDTDTSLRLTGLNSNTPPYVENFNFYSFSCTIITRYPDAWKCYLNDTAKKAGLGDSKFTLENNTSENGLYEVYFNLSNNLYTLNMSKSVIKAELGVGSNFNYISDGTTKVIWDNPADIIYGTALNNTQLNATAWNGLTNLTSQGNFTYTPASGAVLSVGTQTLHVDFTPADVANYTTASKDFTITVKKATPAITWSKPADISYGTALNNTS